MAAPCPICRRAVAVRSQNASYPFCSPACKLVDLGCWLDGRYRIAGPQVDLGAEADDSASMRRNDPNEEDE